MAEQREKETQEGEKGSEGTPPIPVGSGNERFYCVSIFGQVEGHSVLEAGQKSTKYDQLIPLLVALEENAETDGILILLNTLGGDVEAGLAIAEVIASLSKPTVSVVLGGGHSIGVPLAVAAKKSFIVPSATMTLHPVRTSGLVLGVWQSFDYLQKMQGRILDFIAAHSAIAKEELEQLILRTDQLVNDVGSLLKGEEAVKCGLIDSVGGISDAVAALREMKKDR